ncbi:MAG: citrate synthase [Candidatus Sericytochromatia bacterium]|nr:citrate synthase [Candidatus Sericytochromatia bacterium]
MSANVAVNKGLEDVVVSTSSICSIIDDMLTYRGYSIDELTEKATCFEEVVWLLWHGELPSQAQLADIKNTIAAGATLPTEVLTLLRGFPKDANPMDVLRTAVSALGLYDPQAENNDAESNLAKALRLQGQLPTIVAAFERLRQGKEPVAPKAGVTLAYNFLYMMFGEEPDAVSVKAMEKALILHADHEFNASTFCARQTASTLSDMHSCITSAIGTLKGPLHGGANTAVMKMLGEIGSVENAEPWILDALDKKKKVMGFGHRVYENGDPRAKHLRQMSEELGRIKGDMSWYQMSIKVDEVVKREKGLLTNVDFYSASTYHYMGIPGDQFTPIFAISRLSGWAAHVMEQLANNRLIRPRAEYIGPGARAYVPMNAR